MRLFCCLCLFHSFNSLNMDNTLEFHMLFYYFNFLILVRNIYFCMCEVRFIYLVFHWRHGFLIARDKMFLQLNRSIGNRNSTRVTPFFNAKYKNSISFFYCSIALLLLIENITNQLKLESGHNNIVDEKMLQSVIY